ncbi:biopolymer transport protein ExbD/TolR [Moraxella macacae 0408225]|uniref:Biopolymer transport protein ExbD/TolR n=1 Tax=Moraxella macacae 0408225 TaxID=1230338 RepID=L2F680_9GAMM|nr:protein TolR [Moraxella macacae]ELA08420.1 biopolymer transport protein ExbD/TolR [Moraxella macacae 0408225]
MKANPFSRSVKKVNAGMNVVPYIDVMLVLLVIFMVTAPMLTTGVDIDLPKAQTNAIKQGVQMPVIVSLDSKGDVYLSYQDKSDEPVSQSQLITTLQTLQQLPEYQNAEGSTMQVMINADKSNAYGDVMALMAKLQQAGVVKVGLLTAPPESHAKSDKNPKPNKTPKIKTPKDE